MSESVNYESFREGFLACWVWEYGDSRYEPDEGIIRRQYQQWTRTNPAKTKRCEKHGTVIWPRWGCGCCSSDPTCDQREGLCSCRNS